MNNAKLIRIDDDAAVAALGEKYAKAFEFLRRPDLKDLPLGRQEIDGDRCYAIICENDLKPIGEVQRPEFHKRPSSTSGTSTSRRRSRALSSSAFQISPRRLQTDRSTRRATVRFSTPNARCSQ